MPGKENRIIWSGASPGRHREQRSRHLGDCAGKRKDDLLVWRRAKFGKCMGLSYLFFANLSYSNFFSQILDARNPLLFRSPDLEKYVKEVSALKANLILLNKVQYL